MIFLTLSSDAYKKIGFRFLKRLYILLLRGNPHHIFHRLKLLLPEPFVTPLGIMPPQDATFIYFLFLIAATTRFSGFFPLYASNHLGSCEPPTVQLGVYWVSK